MSHSGFGGTDVPDRGNSTCKGAEVVCPRDSKKAHVAGMEGRGAVVQGLGGQFKDLGF